MIVLKIGGSEGINYDLIADDIAVLVKAGQPLIVIHGGSSLTNKVAERLGHPPLVVTSVSGFGSGRSDRGSLELVEMV
jgi:acetylglutamate/LysW-gamma-L-alpha-aminoadipate kinase